jgi:pilus assembly protein CpaB
MLRIVLVIFALAAGGAAAWVAVLMRSEPAPVTTMIQEKAPPTQDVLVATTDLGAGRRLIKENMRWQSWPESALNPAYITRSARPDALETLADSYVRNRMSAGEPIRDENLLPATGGFLSTLLSAGKRAVGVRVTAESTAGGFILPNDRVDVLLTVTPQGQSEDSQGASQNSPSSGTALSAGPATTRQRLPFTRTILRNVPVLAIDQSVDDRSLEEKTKAKAAIVGRTATLELDSRQAEILTAGEATGTISLALRSVADNSEKPPITGMQSGQFVSSSMVGTAKMYHITSSTTAVEITEPATPLGPAWALPREGMPPEPQQVQQGATGFAAVKQGSGGFTVR